MIANLPPGLRDAQGFLRDLIHALAINFVVQPDRSHQIDAVILKGRIFGLRACTK